MLNYYKINNKTFNRNQQNKKKRHFSNCILVNYQDDIDLSFPYLKNLNEDPLLNGKIKYSLKKGIFNFENKDQCIQAEKMVSLKMI